MTLDESYAFCERVARTQAKNFYYSFLLLSRPQRQAMCAIYAFMRYCDDLSDAEGVSDRAGAIAQWQADLDSALAGNAPEHSPQHAVWPAFSDAVARYRIPHEYFRDMIRGVSSDLEPRHIQTFQELYDYCYHVASVVGLTIIHIFGFDNPAARLQLAERCGVAFQLTNILRDVREDAEHGRVYLPEEDLVRFGVKNEGTGRRRAFTGLAQSAGVRSGTRASVLPGIRASDGHGRQPKPRVAQSPDRDLLASAGAHLEFRIRGAAGASPGPRLGKNLDPGALRDLKRPSCAI